MNPRHLLIRLLTPLIWKKFPGLKLSALMKFSLVEKDSACQLLHCLDLVKDPELKAYLFQHVLEEFFHSDIFEALCKEKSESHLYLQMLPRMELVPANSSPDAILDFFAYVHVGEQTVNRDFLVFSEAAFEPDVKSTFRRAGMDEAHHEHDTHDILHKLLGASDGGLGGRTLRARLKLRWRSFNESMISIGKFPMTVILSVIYFLLGGLGSVSARARLQMTEKEQLSLFQQQVREFEGQFP